MTDHSIKRTLDLKFVRLLPAIALLLFSLSSATAQDTAQAAPPSEATASAAVAPSADGIPADEAVITSGKALYENNCTQCHAFNEVVVGPALKDAHTRWKLNNMISFIRYPQKYIETSGDKYAQGLYAQYKQYMPNHDFLSEAEVLSLVAYIKAESVKPAAAPVETAGTPGTATEAKGSGVSNELVSLIFAILIFVLFVFLVILVFLINILKRFIENKEGVPDDEKALVDQKFDLAAFFKSSFFRTSVTVIALLFISKVAFDSIINIGIQQGYSPKQPIAFSHKLHAGEYQIDCNYCHTGAKKGKAAVIPSANVCMNCHNAIKPESPEIKKIYAAIEKDQPIEWVRIHNLPDHAYFNHAQHVTVGGLECQNCHGQIQEMEVVQQYSPLTMGWCINCHRETAVNAENNAYYDKMVSLHKTVSKQPMKVKDIGGLECAKCHY
jgi:mono/diheme cytochrome c family protein